MARIVYSSRYNIGFFGLEKIHPFDSRKYGRAWQVLKEHFGKRIDELHIQPQRQASKPELELVHSAGYLGQLRDSKYVSIAVEIPQIRRLPGWLADRLILRPMRWATRGTILAAESALEHGLAVNLGGGYHHAAPGHGEGFCIYSDIGIAVESLRAKKLIEDDSRVVYIDTDAHQGNGVCRTFANDIRVFIFDIFNSGIYPAGDTKAKERIDCEIGIDGSITDEKYIEELQARLPGFLDSINKRDRSPVSIAIYNAGTDIFNGDPLGGLKISARTILQRDLFVIEELSKRGIPAVMVLSGGYTRKSYQLVADSVIGLIERHHAWQSV